jgi:hypothetical protein
MRSVYVFVRASSDALRAYLESLAPRVGQAEQWIYPNTAKKVLYIEVVDDLYDELEPETVKALLARFGGERVRCVCIDVSRHHSGGSEVEDVVLGLLRMFDGVAMDDGSEHLWTLEELEAGQTYQEHRFFASG